MFSCMYIYRIFCFFLLLSTVVTGCTLNVDKVKLIQTFQSIIPTNDGSSIPLLQTNMVSEMLLNNIVNNLFVLGVKTICHNNSTCDLDLCDERIHLKVILFSIIGNFVNGDLDEHDALAHICIDTQTGLLKRVHKSWWTRLMLADALLVITVTLLAKRVWEKG